MKLPQNVKDLRTKFVAKMGLPSGSEDNFRNWCGKFAAQVVFAFPGAGFGVKSNGSSAPISKDTLAQKTDSYFVVWDLFTGSGTGVANLVEDPDSQDVTGQTFHTVEPHDWIGSGNGNGDPAPPPPVNSNPDLVQAIRDLTNRMDTNTAAVHQLFEAVQNMPVANVDYDRIRSEMAATVNQLLTDHEKNIKEIVASTPVHIKTPFGTLDR